MRRSRSYVQGAVSSVSMRRNKFDLSHGVKTSLSVGTLVPIDVQEVLPGDTFSMHETHVVRLTSSYLRPVMDNCWLDTYSFFVPLRLLYDDAESVFGVAEPSEYVDSELAEFPVTTEASTVSPGSIADYMGLPVTPSGSTKKLPKGINILPFRAFAMIYNEWFRNENVQQSVFVQKGEFSDTEVFNGDEWSQTNYTGMPPKITKKKDYFTSCLPAPQKGDPVSLALGKEAPIKGQADVTIPDNTIRLGNAAPGSGSFGDNFFNPIWYNSDGNPFSFQSGLGVNFTGGGGRTFAGDGVSIKSPELAYLLLSNRNAEPFPIDLGSLGAYADLSSTGVISVNDLRFAFQLQKMYEKDARYGTRYREYLLGHFGVSNADARMQVPEFLGGHRTPLGTQAVTQTSAQSTQGTPSAGLGGTPLGTLGGMSHSVGKSRYVKSFTEHGYVITVAAIRQLHTYQQGIEKFWSRKERNDFYDPLFANLGEQPVYDYQLYGFQSAGAALGDGDVFGYNEYGAEYRYRPSYITGQLRTGVENSLDIYHFGDYYENAPTLSPKFINESPEYFDRTVAVPSSSQDNFILDFWFDVKAVRVMPLYSIPGLIDHH